MQAGGGMGRGEPGAGGRQGWLGILKKFWSSFLKYPRKAFPLRYGSCLRSLRRVSAVSGTPKLSWDTFRNRPKLSSIRDTPSQPPPALQSPLPNAPHRIPGQQAPFGTAPAGRTRTVLPPIDRGREKCQNRITFRKQSLL